MSPHINSCSTLNNEHNWEDLCIHFKSQQTRTSDNHKLNHGKFDFRSGCCIRFIVDLLHKFCCVNLCGRGWRTWKTNQVTPTCKHHKGVWLKETGLCLDTSIISLHNSEHNWVLNTIGRTCVSSSDIDKHALPITTTKSWEVWFFKPVVAYVSS